MARSPYAAPRRAPRWPWFAGATVVLALIAFAGVAASTGSLTEGPAVDRLAQQQGTPTSAPEPTPTATDAATEVAAAPSATPDPGEAQVRSAERWFALWAEGDFSGMYAMTANSTRTVVSEAEFVERYQGIQLEAGVKSITAEVTGEVDGDAIPYAVTFESNLLGEFRQDNRLSLVQEGGQWLVAWSPSLIFTQIGDTGCVDWQGETLKRGRILDADGVVLAEDAQVALVGVVPGDLPDDGASIDALGRILDMDPEDIRARYQREGVDPNWNIPIRTLPYDETVNIANQLIEQGLTGVIVNEGFSRVYAHGPLFAHVTGYVSPATEEDVMADETGSVQADQMVGRSGLEFGANEMLAGKPGGTLNVIECDTRAVRDVIADIAGDPPRDITITIDLEFQQQVFDSVANLDQLRSVPGDGTDLPTGADDDAVPPRGAAVVLDPSTGAVMAMVSSPTFDPNDFVTGSFDDKELAMLSDPVLRPEANRATVEVYPAGSIFKLITTAAAMKDLGFTAETPIDCPASYTIGDNVWNDWVVENGLSAQGDLTLHSGLVRSCNTVFYQIGHWLDDENANLLPDMAMAFGLGGETGIDYYPESSGVVPNPEWKLEEVGDGWATGDNVNLSIGQGYLLVTPLQMATAYAAVANGGDVLVPYLVDRAQAPGSDEVQQIGQREVAQELPLTDQQIIELQLALREQTSNDNGVGSSRIFGDWTWPIAGKTGTAQNGPQDGTVPPHSWFAAYGPAGQQATIASAVMFEQVGEGIQYAAPVTRAIFEAFVRDGETAGGP